MFYVPYVPPQPPSPRTRELADVLTRAIEEYEKYHPNVSGAEVRAALQMASARSSKAIPARMWAVLGALVTLTLGGVFAFVAANQGQVSGDAVPMIGVAVVTVGLLVVVAMLKARG